MKLVFVLLYISLSTAGFSRTEDEKMISLMEEFAEEHEKLSIPIFSYGFLENFKNIPNIKDIEKQHDLYLKYHRLSQSIRESELSVGVKHFLKMLQYEVAFNLERVSLERSFKLTGDSIPSEGIFSLRNHKRWYRLYAMRWSATPISPTELIALGEREVKKVKTEIELIQEKLGYHQNDEGFYDYLNSDDFFITDLKLAIDSYNEKQSLVLSLLGNLFKITDVKPAEIKPITDANETTPPGMYKKGTFFLNFYGERHNKRVMDWLFIHETLPGHHYHYAVAEMNSTPIPKYRDRFWYPGHSEGWAAYTEHLGESIGLYQDDLMWLGKWEWDIVRSVRVVMDVGINNSGWSDVRAMNYWKSHIKNQDDDGIRAIKRIKRWPGQVISYKVGEARILKVKKMLQKSLGDQFDIKEFHHTAIKYKSMPLDVLEATLIDELAN